MEMSIYTIGYEGLDIDAFIWLLDKREIETLLDIRELPLSRKPGFSKKSLAGVLAAAGIEYIHLPELGCPKAVRDRYREDSDWGRYTRGFLKHLRLQAAALEEVSRMAMTLNCALMCYEADYAQCHRSMVASAVRETCGTSIEHIKSSELRTGRPVAQRRDYA